MFDFIIGGMSVLMVVVGAAGLFVAIRRLKD